MCRRPVQVCPFGRRLHGLDSYKSSSPVRAEKILEKTHKPEKPSTHIELLHFIFYLQFFLHDFAFCKMELPFVKAIRVKEIKIKIKSKNDASSPKTPELNGLENHVNQSFINKITVKSDDSQTDEDFDDHDDTEEKYSATTMKSYDQERYNNESRSRIDLMRQLGASSILSSAIPSSSNGVNDRMTSSTYTIDHEDDGNPTRRPESSRFSTKNSLTRNFFGKKTKVYNGSATS